MTVKRLASTLSKRKMPTTVPAKPKETVTLATDLSVPSDNLGDYTVLIHGEKKIGKTSLSSFFPGAHFFMFEPGAKALAIYQRAVTEWSQFKEYRKLISNQKKFRTAVIDTGDIAYDRCMDYTCRRLGIDHPGDENDYGKSWKAVKEEFVREIAGLASCMGLVVLSHSQEVELKRRDGTKYHRIQPSLSGQARAVLEGLVDIWCYYEYRDGHRVLVIAGDDHVAAGHRLERRFRTTSGDAIRSIPMGMSAKEGFDNFMVAFNNKQRTVEAYPEEKPTTTTVKPSAGVRRVVMRKK